MTSTYPRHAGQRKGFRRAPKWPQEPATEIIYLLLAVSSLDPELATTDTFDRDGVYPVPTLGAKVGAQPGAGEALYSVLPIS